MLQSQRTLVTDVGIPLLIKENRAAEHFPAPLIKLRKTVNDFEFPFAIDKMSEFQR